MPLRGIILALVVLSFSALAVKVDIPGEAERVSTHIVTGTLISSTPVVETTGARQTTRCVGLLKVDAVERGADIMPGEELRVHYICSVTWIAPGTPPPRPGPHSNIPRLREQRRVLLTKKPDGSFNVYYVGGFQNVGKK